MGIGFDARSNTNERILSGAHFSCDARDALNFFKAINNDVTDTCCDAFAQFLLGLIVAVYINIFDGKTRTQGKRQLAAA